MPILWFKPRQIAVSITLQYVCSTVHSFCKNKERKASMYVHKVRKRQPQSTNPFSILNLKAKP